MKGRVERMWSIVAKGEDQSLLTLKVDVLGAKTIRKLISVVLNNRQSAKGLRPKPHCRD